MRSRHGRHLPESVRQNDRTDKVCLSLKLGVVLGDGVVLSDSVLALTTSASASVASGQAVLTNGDSITGMTPTPDLMLLGW